MSRILVCGSRDWVDPLAINEVLSCYAPDVLAHGGARGADLLAGEWADEHDVPVIAYPADWRQYGKRAGPIRNHQMLADFRPDLVLAFKDNFDNGLRRGGTEHMVRIARRADVRCRLIFHRVVDPELCGRRGER